MEAQGHAQSGFDDLIAFIATDSHAQTGYCARLARRRGAGTRETNAPVTRIVLPFTPKSVEILRSGALSAAIFMEAQTKGSVVNQRRLGKNSQKSSADDRRPIKIVHLTSF